MSICREKGIVLSSRLINENDILITFLPENSVKRKLLAKGLKKSKRRPVAASEPAAYIEVDFYEKNRNVFYIKELVLLERFELIKSSYGGFLLITYFAELVDMILQENEITSDYFVLLFSALQTLEKKKYAPSLLPYFKYKLGLLSGMALTDFHCSKCNKNVESMISAHISHMDMSVICEECNQGYGNDLGLVQILNLFAQKKYAEIYLIQMEQKQILATDVFLNHFLNAYLGREVKSQGVLYDYLGENYELSY